MALLESVLAVSIAATCSAPSLGAEVTNISHRIRRERQIPSFVTGALVGPVWNGGPAARAGFESGDVIQGVGDELVQNVCEFERALSRQRCGEVRFAVRRGTRNLEITAALADAGRLRRPKRSDAAACRDGDGAACRNLAGRDDAVDHFLRQGCDLGDGESCYRLAL
ncbi:MAG TPA: PDZ domain-containing protein, partial [Thermoanaerobaculia bacterium]|nr:PDZ domain-containing protein [Thermoanaerobaculia bacterium]